MTIRLDPDAAYTGFELPDDESTARILGFSRENRRLDKVPSRNLIDWALNNERQTLPTNECTRAPVFVHGVNLALAVKSPVNAAFAKATKTLTWEKPTWNLPTTYRVRRRLSTNAADEWTQLADDLSSTTLVDSAYDSSRTTLYGIRALANPGDAQETILVVPAGTGTDTKTVRIDPVPPPVCASPGATRKLSYTESGTGGTVTLRSWEVTHGTLSSSTAKSPTWTLPTALTEDVEVTITLNVTIGTLDFSQELRVVVERRTLGVDLSWADFPSGLQPNFLYGSPPVLLKKVLSGCVAIENVPTLVYSITHGTLSLSPNTPGTSGSLTVVGPADVYWHIPSPPFIESGTRVVTKVDATLTATAGGLTAQDAETCYLEWPPPLDGFFFDVEGARDLQEGTTLTLTATPRGSAEGDIVWEWLDPIVGSLGVPTSSNAGSSVVYSAPADVTRTTPVSVTCRAVRQNIRHTETVTFNVTDSPTFTADFSLWAGTTEYPTSVEYGTSYQARGEFGGTAEGDIGYSWAARAGTTTGRRGVVWARTNTRLSSAARPSAVMPTENTTGVVPEWIELMLTATRYVSGSSGPQLTASTPWKRWNLAGTVPPPPPPRPTGGFEVRISGGRNTVRTGARFTLNGSGSGTFVGTDTFAWSASGGTLSATTGTSTTWTAPNATGTYSIRLDGTRTNSQGDTRTDDDTHFVVVVDRDPPLEIDVSGMPSRVSGNTGVSLAAVVSGGTGAAHSIAWTQTQGSSSPTTGNAVVWTSPTVAVDTPASVTATVTQGTATASDTVNTTVAAPAVPTFSLSLAGGRVDEGGTLNLLATTGASDTATGPITGVSWSRTGGVVTPGSGLAATWQAPLVNATTSYSVTISATRQGITASATAVVTSVNIIYAPPNAPTVATSNATFESFLITWAPGATGPRISPVTGWEITVTGGGQTFSFEAGPAGRSILATGLAEQTTYAVSVNATSIVGDGPPGTATATTLARPLWTMMIDQSNPFKTAIRLQNDFTRTITRNGVTGDASTRWDITGGEPLSGTNDIFTWRAPRNIPGAREFTLTCQVTIDALTKEDSIVVQVEDWWLILIPTIEITTTDSGGSIQGGTFIHTYNYIILAIIVADSTFVTRNRPTYAWNPDGPQFRNIPFSLIVFTHRISTDNVTPSTTVVTGGVQNTFSGGMIPIHNLEGVGLIFLPVGSPVPGVGVGPGGQVQGVMGGSLPPFPTGTWCCTATTEDGRSRTGCLTIDADGVERSFEL